MRLLTWLLTSQSLWLCCCRRASPSWRPLLLGMMLRPSDAGDALCRSSGQQHMALICPLVRSFIARCLYLLLPRSPSPNLPPIPPLPSGSCQLSSSSSLRNSAAFMKAYIDFRRESEVSCHVMPWLHLDARLALTTKLAVRQNCCVQGSGSQGARGQAGQQAGTCSVFASRRRPRGCIYRDASIQWGGATRQLTEEQSPEAGRAAGFGRCSSCSPASLCTMARHAGNEHTDTAASDL